MTGLKHSAGRVPFFRSRHRQQAPGTALGAFVTRPPWHCISRSADASLRARQAASTGLAGRLQHRSLSNPGPLKTTRVLFPPRHTPSSCRGSSVAPPSLLHSTCHRLSEEERRRNGGGTGERRGWDGVPAWRHQNRQPGHWLLPIETEDLHVTLVVAPQDGEEGAFVPADIGVHLHLEGLAAHVAEWLE